MSMLFLLPGMVSSLYQNPTHPGRLSWFKHIFVIKPLPAVLTGLHLTFICSHTTTWPFLYNGHLSCFFFFFFWVGAGCICFWNYLRNAKYSVKEVVFYIIILISSTTETVLSHKSFEEFRKKRKLLKTLAHLEEVLLWKLSDWHFYEVGIKFLMTCVCVWVRACVCVAGRRGASRPGARAGERGDLRPPGPRDA